MVIYNGNTYNSEKELHAKNAVAGVSFGAFKMRLKNGWDLERALTEPVRRKAKAEDVSIEYGGETFTSISSLYRAHASECVSLPAFVSRIKAGWDIDDALTLPKQQEGATKGPFVIDGVTYANLKSLGDAAGLKHDQLYARYRRGWTPEEIFHGRSRVPKAPAVAKVSKQETTIAGVTYPSMVEACRRNGIKPVTYRYRINSGWTKEQALGLEGREDKRSKRIGREYIVRGATYPSISSLSSAFGVNGGTVRDRLKKGYSIEIAVGIEPVPKVKKRVGVRRKYVLGNKTYSSLHEVGKAVNISGTTLDSRMRNMNLTLVEAISYTPHGKKVLCHGVGYASYAALAKAYGVATHIVYDRIRRGYTPEETVDNPDLRKTFHEEVIVGGVKYLSIADACNAIGRTPVVVNANMEEGATVEQAFDLDWAANPILVEGKKFKTISAVADHYDINASLIKSRMGLGYNIEDALGLTGINFSNSGCYNEVFFKRNPERSGDSAVLYFVEIAHECVEGTFHKVGITARNVKSRFNGSSHYTYDEITTVNTTLRDAYDFEQLLHIEYHEYEFMAPLDFEGRTECFRFTDALVIEVKALLETLQESTAPDLKS